MEINMTKAEFQKKVSRYIGLPLPKYQSHKVVGAARIGNITLNQDGTAELDLVFENKAADRLKFSMSFPLFHASAGWMAKHNPEVNGYFVLHEDGYTSCPAEAFEAGFTRINDNTGKTMGQVAYEARCAAGRKIPGDWNSMDNFDKIMWEDTASIITAEVLARFK